MTCPVCGEALPEDSKFCQFCGNKIEYRQERKERVPAEESAVQKAFADQKEKIESDKETKRRKRRSVLYGILGVTLAVLVAVNSVQSKNIERLSSQYDDVQEQLDSANQSVQEQDETIRSKDASIQQYIEERDQYKENNETYTRIEQWIAKHGKGYKEDKSFYAGSNVIAVKTGESATLDVYYKGKRTVWCSATSDECSTKLGKKSASNIQKLTVTGEKAGITELVFALGKKKKADDKESFRVLVIVTP